MQHQRWSETSAFENTGHLLHRALRHHLDRDLAGAEALYRQVLKRDPAHPRALGMLALILADDPDDTIAEQALLDHLEVVPGSGSSLHELGRLRARQGFDATAVGLFRRASQASPALAPVYNDLGMSLYRLGDLHLALSELDRAVALDPNYALAHRNRGMVLLELNAFAEAIEALLAALTHGRSSSQEFRSTTLHSLCHAARMSGQMAVAVSVGQLLLDEEYSDPETIEELASIFDYAKRPEDARALRNDVSRRSGLIRRGRRGATTVMLLGGVGSGNIPTRYLVDADQLCILSLGLLSPDQPDAPFGNIDQDVLERADVVFNIVGNADRDGGQLDVVDALAAKIDIPLLNAPQRIRKTTRVRAAELFMGIPHLVVPKTVRATPADAESLSAESAWLARPRGDHGGDNVFLLQTASDKAAFLHSASENDSLLTEFYNFQSLDGFWRKYRFIFVNGKAYPFHLAIGDDWLLHYWRTRTGSAQWKKEEEEQFLGDWRSVFGPKASRAVIDVAQRLDLDYGGLDCGITTEGEVVFFEANACMLVHLDEPAKAFAYKHAYVPRIRDAFSQMVRDHALKARKR